MSLFRLSNHIFALGPDAQELRVYTYLCSLPASGYLKRDFPFYECLSEIICGMIRSRSGEQRMAGKYIPAANRCYDLRGSSAGPKNPSAALAEGLFTQITGQKRNQKAGKHERFSHCADAAVHPHTAASEPACSAEAVQRTAGGSVADRIKKFVNRISLDHLSDRMDHAKVAVGRIRAVCRRCEIACAPAAV